MFIQNKYYNVYFKIIENAKLQNRIKTDTSYFEKHHILPRSMGGNNKKTNLVLLTTKEHYICHLLLVKMCSNPKDRSRMVSALNLLSKYGYTSRLSAFFREKYFTETRGENHHLFGKHLPKEHKQKLSASRTGEKNHFFGKTHSDESKRLMSKNNPARRDEIKVKISRANKGKLPWNTGKEWDETTRQKISENLKGRSYRTEEGKKAQSERVKNTVWINCNGVCKMVKDDEADKWLSEGWCRGRK